MRLRAWLRREGKSIAWLARVTGLSYPTVFARVHEKHEAEARTAQRISAATGGEVTLEDLLCPPRSGRKRAA